MRRRLGMDPDMACRWCSPPLRNTPSPSAAQTSKPRARPRSTDPVNCPHPQCSNLPPFGTCQPLKRLRDHWSKRHKDSPQPAWLVSQRCHSAPPGPAATIPAQVNRPGFAVCPHCQQTVRASHISQCALRPKDPLRKKGKASANQPRLLILCPHCHLEKKPAHVAACPEKPPAPPPPPAAHLLPTARGTTEDLPHLIFDCPRLAGLRRQHIRHIVSEAARDADALKKALEREDNAILLFLDSAKGLLEQRER